MQETFIIENQDLEKISEILNVKHLELLKLIFGGHSSRFNIVDPKSSFKKNNEVLRVIIAFSIKNPKYGFRKYKLNIKLSKNYLVFSIQLDEQLGNLLKDNLNLVNIFSEIGLQVESKKIADHPLKNGTNGQQHSISNHVSNGFGKLPRRLKGKTKGFTRKQKKERKKK